MVRTALVVGGTGPTGPHVIDGLLSRGYDITVFHRGRHELPELNEVEHIHGDPHFRETIDDALGNRQFDLVLAAYGRIMHLAAALTGRAGKFIAISGTPRYAGYSDPWRIVPSGPAIPIREDGRLVTSVDADGSAGVKFGQKIVEGEQAVFRFHPTGTVLVYPVIYGPRNLTPWEWSVIKRVNDGRRRIVLPDGGLAIHRRGAARNMAEYILRTADRPDATAGQVYNCADEQHFSLRQWVELIVDVMGTRLDIVGVPSELAPILKAIYIPNHQSVADHTLFNIEKAKRDLGYADVVSPRAALTESVAWYTQNPVSAEHPPPGYHDRFDYELEDRIASVWERVAREYREEVVTPAPEDFHPMPHPVAPGSDGDQRSR